MKDGRVNFGVHVFGCKLNFAEASSMARRLQEEGYVRCDDPARSQYYIVHSCTVTQEAERQCRYLIRRLHRENPDLKIIVTGCYAQLRGDELLKLPGVVATMGRLQPDKVLQVLSGDGFLSCTAGEDVFIGSYSWGDRTRVFLKVQDGCDYGCSFCTIPMARGRSRSPSVEEIVSQAKRLVEEGAREIVLTGVNIGDFGKVGRRRKHTFYDLVVALEEALPEGVRVRISSIEPNLLTEKIVKVVAGSSKWMPHFHIPLQSGSDRILKLMRRRYDTNLYRERIQMIREHIPDCAIGVDVIVGFPGETEEEFMRTYEFIQSLDITYLHVFPYSERPGTDAIKMDGKIPIGTRKERVRILRKLSEEKKLGFYKRFIGQTRPVLLERPTNGFVPGFTDNYIKVLLSEDEINGIDSIANIRLEEIIPFKQSIAVRGKISEKEGLCMA